MPFQSEKQRRFMWKFHPVIARRWAHEYGNTPRKKEFEEGHSGHKTKKE